MSEKELSRLTHNSRVYIISYIFMGLMSGVAFDVLVTFLQQVDIGTAQSFSSFMGLSNFVCAAILLLVPKLGYKKLIISGPIVTIIALLAVSYVSVPIIYPIATLLILSGVTLFDVILPPYFTAYTTEETRTKTFSRAMYTNTAGMVVATWFGGTLAVNRFASRLGISKDAAAALTEKVKEMSSEQLTQYTLAQRDVLLMFVVIVGISLIPLLFIKEEKSDYYEEKPKTEKKKFDWSIFKNKYVVLWLLYYAMIRFGASLICPYFSVFLNNELGISRATTSQLVSYQYFAMVIFLILSPYVVKKLGKVVTLGGVALLSIPFMLIIANGRAFGSSMVLAVGLGLFLRSGFMNCGNPVMQSLPMEFVPKNLRPAYNSLIFISGGITSILAGQFTKFFLFKLESGYSIAYYITGIVYVIASIMVITVYKKKYNQIEESEEDVEDIA